MSKENALMLLQQLKERINISRQSAENRGIADYYERDVDFIETATAYLESDDHRKIQWVLNEMRNLSQGFGSYCSEQKELTAILDGLFLALQNLLTCR